MCFHSIAHFDLCIFVILKNKFYVSLSYLKDFYVVMAPRLQKLESSNIFSGACFTFEENILFYGIM